MLLVALKKSENCEHSYAAANASLDLNLKPSEDWEFRDHKCRFTDCVFCKSTVAYIAGFLVFSLKDLIHCEECLHALQHSDDDKCPNKSLILLKDYSKNSDKTCLQMPSGSLCALLNTAEVVFRKRLHHINDKLATEKLAYCTLKELPDNLFPTLTNVSHSICTSDGENNHVLTIIRLILKKYFVLRIKKVLKDKKKDQDGNRIHRLRIFKGQ